MMIQTTFFDYQQLDSEARINLKQRAERICERTRGMAVSIWENGKDFYEAQQELAHHGHGIFQRWAEAETGYSHQTVYRFIRVYEKINYNNLLQLNIAASALYLLTAPSTPEEAFQEATDRAQNGEVITPGKAKEIVEDHKKAKQEKEEADGNQNGSQPVTLFNELESEQEQDIEPKKEPEPQKPVAPPKPPKPKSETYTVQAWSSLSDSERQEILSYPPQTGAKFNTQAEQDEALKEEDIAGIGNIEWALWSWNPVTGCLHNCPYCYARDIANRFYKEIEGDRFQPVFRPGRLLAPQNTKPSSQQVTNPIKKMGLKNVFTCSMADLFGKWVPSEWIEAVLEQVRANPQWNFLLLTKFPQRMAEFDYPANAWLGTSVDHQWAVDRAEKAFRKLRANGYKGVAWLSCEPMMERLTFSSLDMFNWVVIGGASRSSQTPEFKPPREWVTHLWNQADQAGCKVYEKTNLLERRREYPW